MEEQKIDKRTKEYKAIKAGIIAGSNEQEEVAMNIALQNVSNEPTAFVYHSPDYKSLIANGIPLNKAEFIQAVNNGDDVPERYFSKASAASSRRVEMWLCAGGTILVCHHKNALKQDKYFFTPINNVKYANFN